MFKKRRRKKKDQKNIRLVRFDDNNIRNRKSIKLNTELSLSNVSIIFSHNSVDSLKTEDDTVSKVLVQ